MCPFIARHLVRMFVVGEYLTFVGRNTESPLLGDCQCITSIGRLFRDRTLDAVKRLVVPRRVR